MDEEFLTGNCRKDRLQEPCVHCGWPVARQIIIQTIIWALSKNGLIEENYFREPIIRMGQRDPGYLQEIML